jgi:hypothetical protein
VRLAQLSREGAIDERGGCTHDLASITLHYIMITNK